MSQVIDQSIRFRGLQRPLLLTGVIGIALCIIGAFFNIQQFFRSYLLAYIFWTGIALGCLGILMIQYLTGGAWGLIIRRTLESASLTLPLMLVLFVPLLFGMHSLYIWTRPEAVASDALLQHKQGYLNVPFFIIRAAIYFILWIAAAYLLNRWSIAQDRTGEPGFSLKLQRLSGPGLFLLAITLSLAMIDWVMSLEPRWYSTIYGVIFMAGEGLAAFAFATVVAILLAGHQPLSETIRQKHLHDLGNLLLTFVMLWAYCSFAQFLLIWSGNLREEVPWYSRRLHGGWGITGFILIVFHFFLPFLLLLFREVKRYRVPLAIIAVVVLGMRFVDLIWLIVPAFHPANFVMHWMDFLAAIGIGGLWLSVFVWRLKQTPLLPIHDPYLEEMFDDEDE
jgi:hypothetical protein